jgi:putative FmdB family regulatory protein
MPTYAYRGDECGHEFEIRQSFSDDPVSVCPECGKPVHRVIHPAGIVFKGSGWYITDSRPTTESSGGVQDAAKVSGKSETPADTATSAPKAEPVAAGASAGKDS